MKQWIEKIKTMGREQTLILLLTGILFLVIALPVKENQTSTVSEQAESAGVSSDETGVQDNLRSYASALEERLMEVLGQVEGAGEVEVMLTLKSGGRRQVEKDVSQAEESNSSDASAQSQYSESTVFVQNSDGSETPYIIEETQPEIAGVLVVAQGGGDARIAAEITEAVRALFGVEAHKIRVMKRKAGG